MYQAVLKHFDRDDYVLLEASSDENSQEEAGKLIEAEKFWLVSVHLVSLACHSLSDNLGMVRLTNVCYGMLSAVIYVAIAYGVLSSSDFFAQ